MAAELRHLRSRKAARGRGRARASHLPASRTGQIRDLAEDELGASPQSLDPPSTWMMSPVIQRASSDAKKATTPPMSSG
jgi:hypothetical protein